MPAVSGTRHDGYVIPELPVRPDAVERVLVAGDWHGIVPVHVLEKAADLGIAVVAHVGDLGIGPWPGERKSVLHVLDRVLTRLDLVLLLTPGNHENWDRLEEAKRDAEGRWILGRTGRVRGLPRGHRWTMGGRAFGSLGGAVSIDQDRRTPGRTWWPQEEVLPEHVDALGDDRLDILITHEVPAGVPVVSTLDVPAVLAERADAGRGLIRDAVERTCPEVVFSGHWHQRVTHDLARRAGGVTRVEVLSEECTPGNAAVLDLIDLSVWQLGDVWRRERAR